MDGLLARGWSKSITVKGNKSNSRTVRVRNSQERRLRQQCGAGLGLDRCVCVCDWLHRTLKVTVRLLGFTLNKWETIFLIFKQILILISCGNII